MRKCLPSVIIATLFATVASASLYDWNPTKRPPVSLEDVLGRANTLLGDDAANRYCVSATLYGNKVGDGRRGAWNLYFAATDGSIKHVSMNLQGDAHVKYYPPIDWSKTKGRRSGLEDVKKRFDRLFSEVGVDAKVSLQKNRLSVRYRTRVFKIHPRLENGEYGDNLEEMIGPRKDGIVIDIFETDKRDPNWDSSSFGLYGTQIRGQYLLTGKHRFLNVDFRYGGDLQHQPPFKENRLIEQIYQVFGEKTGWP